MQFNIGDRVIYLRRFGPDEGTRIPLNTKGRAVQTAGDTIGVEWDINIGGHNCGGRTRNKHGWYVHKNSIQLVGTHVSLSPADVKYADVILKSRQLQQKFLKRKERVYDAF